MLFILNKENDDLETILDFFESTNRGGKGK